MIDGQRSPAAGSGALAEALERLAEAPEDETARLAFHAALSGAELVLWLKTEPDEPGALAPRVFPLETGPTVLAFDGEAALAGFAGASVPYAALPGRVLVRMLAEGGGNGEAPLSLLVQTESGAAELMSPAALAWLAETLAAPAPEAATATAGSFGPPRLPAPMLASLITVLERRLTGVPGLEAAVLAQVHWQDGGSGHLLALSGLPPEARAPLSRAVAEALALSGLDLPGLDIVFPAKAQADAIAKPGLRLSPAPFAPPSAPAPPAAPGTDPARPPRLR